jgi:hypothetical protein
MLQYGALTIISLHIRSPPGEQPELGISAAIEGLRQFLAWDTFARRKIDFVDRKVGERGGG